MRTAACIFVAVFAFVPGVGAQPPASSPALPDRNPAADAHAGKAAQLLQDRRYSEAAAEFALAVAADPNNDTVRIQYATCLFIEENDEQSREQFEIERRRLGDLPGLTYYLGRLDLRASDFAQAIHRLEPLAANPAFPKASFYLGLAYTLLPANKNRRSILWSWRPRPIPPIPKCITGWRASIRWRAAGLRRTASTKSTAMRARHNGWSRKRATRAWTHCGRSRSSTRAWYAGRLRIRRTRGACFCQGSYTPKAAISGMLGTAARGDEARPHVVRRVALLGLSLYWLKSYREALPALQRAVGLNPQYFETLNLLAATFHALGNDARRCPFWSGLTH